MSTDKPTSIIGGAEDLNQILDRIPGLVNTSTAAGEVEYLNQQVLDYFGRSLDELKSWSTTDLVHPDDLPRVLHSWKVALETGQPYNVDCRLRRADGVFRWFNFQSHPHRDTSGCVVRRYNLLTDIHERKQAEEEQRLAREALEKALDEVKRLSERLGAENVVLRASEQELTRIVELQVRFNRLTPREREVMAYVISGFPNKATAAELGTSLITVGVHRGHVMHKMGAQSLAELIRMADKLGIPPLQNVSK